MMTKNEQAARVKAMCEYLAGIGQPVSNVQGYELLARALGLKNKHVLASRSSEQATISVAAPASETVPASVVVDGVTVVVRPVEAAPFSFAEMVALGWQFDVVIAVPLDTLDGDIERLNDFASNSITGNESALESLVFTHVPAVNYGQGYVAQRVEAYVSAPEEVFEEAQAAADASFYSDLAELSKEIERGARVVLRSADNPTDVREGVVSAVVLLAEIAGTAPADLFLEYATSCGANNDAVNAAGKETVFELKSVTNPDELLGVFTLSDLKYATKVATRTWSFSVGSKGRLVEMRFR